MATPGGATVEYQIVASLGNFTKEFKRATGLWAAQNRQMRAQARRTQRTVTQTFNTLRFSILSVAGALGTRQIKEYADTWQTAQNLLKTVTSSSEELVRVQERVFQTAQDTRTSFEGTNQLYSRLARSTRDLGVSEDELFKITETVNKSIALSGATAQEARNGIIQFGQGLASSRLAGDELRAVLEQLPRLAIAIADGMGKGLGDLRELGKQGALTTEVVLNALRTQVPQIEKEFKSFVPTVEQTFVQIENSLVKRIGGPLSQVLQPAVKVLGDEFIDLVEVVSGSREVWSVFFKAGLVAINGLVNALGGLKFFFLLVEQGLVGVQAGFAALTDTIEASETPLIKSNRLLKERQLIIDHLREKGIGSEFSGSPFSALADEVSRFLGLDTQTELAAINDQLRELGLSDDNIKLVEEFERLQRVLVSANKELEFLLDNNMQQAAASLREGINATENQLGALRETIEDELGADFFEPTLTKFGELQEQIAANNQKIVDLYESYADDKGAADRIEELIQKNRELAEQQGGLPEGAEDAARSITAQVEGIIATEQRLLEARRALQFQGQEEARRIILDGRREISAELQSIIDKEIEAEVEAELEKARLLAEASGKPSKFEKPGAEAQLRADTELEIWRRYYDDLQKLREDFLKKGGVGIGSRELSQLGKDLQKQLEVQRAGWLEQADVEREIRLAAADSLSMDRETAGEALKQQAIRLAIEEVNARFEAERAAEEALGIVRNPEEQANLEEERVRAIQERINEVFGELLSERTRIERESQFKSTLFQQIQAKKVDTVWGKTWDSISDAVRQYGQVNEQVGKAVFLFDQGVAIADTIMATYENAVKAYGWGVKKGGPAAGAAAAGAAIAFGLAQVAAIAATTIGTINQGQSGGGGGGGGFSSAPSGAEEPAEVERQSAVQIFIEGNILGDNEATKQWLIDTISDAVNERDVVVVNAGSRNAQEIRQF